MENDDPTNLVRKRGAPVGNMNSLKTGRGQLRGFDLGRVPRRYKKARADVMAMRDALEEAYLANGGCLGPWALGVLQAASREELRARLLMSMLTKDLDTLPTSDKIGLLRDVSQATHARNRALRELGLNAPGNSIPVTLQDAIKQLTQAGKDADATAPSP